MFSDILIGGFKLELKTWEVDIMSIFQSLKDHLNGEVIDTILQESLELESGKGLTLEDKLLVIKYLLPLTPSLPKSTLKNVFRLFNKDITLLSQLIRFTQDLKGANKEKSLLQNFIIEYISTTHSILYEYITALPLKNNKFQRNSINAIFFGSQLFNLLFDEKGTFTILDYLTILTNQWKFLIKVIKNSSTFKQWNTLGGFLSSLLSFHPKYTSSNIIDGIFLNTSTNFSALLKLLEQSSMLDRSRIINNFVLVSLKLKCFPNNYTTIHKILKKLFNIPKYFIDPQTIVNLKLLEFQEIVIRSITDISESKKLIELLLDLFKETSIYSNSIDEDTQNETDDRITKLLYICLEYNFSPEERLELSHHEKFLDCVTYRLGNKNNDMRERTMFLAKFLTDGGLKYETNFELKIPNIALADGFGDIDFTSLTETSLEKVAIKDTNQLSLMSKKVTQLSLQDSDDEDSDDEDSDDEDEDAKVGKDRKYIVFLKDLLGEYLNTNQNQRNDLVSLLKQTVKLVRQKSLLPLEVSYYSEELIKNIVALNNNFEEKDFEQWRINALISLLVVVPDKVNDLYQLLFNSDLSLQQRMSVLSSVGLAARELRGLDDANVMKPKFDFPSKRLPWDKPATTSNQIEDISNRSLVKDGTTTWKSKKLELASSKLSTKKNEFRKCANNFFYPLANGWLNGIDLGSFDKIFKAHYVATLRIVYSCANPVHNYEAMTQIMEVIVSQAMEQNVPLDM
ncbi:telomere binding protein [Monosporozyma unispora]|nr:telomere binding protein [Kazachstania unispora]